MLKRWAAWPRATRWLAGGIAAAVLALAFVWALFVPVADWLAHHDAGSATGPLHETAVDNARGRLLTLGAGLVAVAALVFTALNFSLLRRNSEQADQWQRRSHELTEQGQVTGTPRPSSSSARTSSTCASAASMPWSASPATQRETTRR